MSDSTRPQKIFLVVPTLGGGGAEKVISNLADEWHSLGYKVVVFTKNECLPKATKLDPGVKMVHGRGSWIRLISRLGNELSKSKNVYILSTLDAASGAVFIAKLFRLLPHDCIWLARQAGPVLARQKKKWDFRRWFLGELRRLAFEFSDGIISNSLSTKSSILQERQKFAKKRHFVIRNPVFDASELDSLVGCAKTPLINVGHPRIVVISSLRPIKRIRLAIEAVAVLINKGEIVFLDIYGEGEEREFLQDLIDRLKLSGYIRLMGYLHDVRNSLSQYQMLLHPSEYEGFGNVIVEALASGLQVIADSSSGSPVEILNEGEFGFLVDCSSPLVLAHQIMCSLSCPLDKQILLSRARNYLTGDVAEEYLDAFKRTRVPEIKS